MTMPTSSIYSHIILKHEDEAAVAAFVDALETAAALAATAPQPSIKVRELKGRDAIISFFGEPRCNNNGQDL